MNKAVKGALWSGLVLPGMGQLVLRHYLRGALFLAGSLTCLAVLMVQAIAQASAILANLDLGNAAIEPGALLAEVDRVSRASSGTTGIFSWLLLFLWLGGTVDAWLLGRREDRQAEPRQPPPPGL